jgi:protein-tyrosine phosphatase
MRTVVDLRDDGERSLLPTNLGEVVAKALHRPLDPRALLPGIPEGTDDVLGALYVRMVRERGDRLARIVTELAEPGALPALVHCAAGKDRTGVVVALVLTAVGVPDDVVVDDYTLTADYLTPAFYAGLPREAGATAPDEEHLRAAAPRSITAMLRAIRTDHGSVPAYLGAHGVPPETLDRLRAALTD